MFIVLLRFTSKREEAGAFMAGHNEWIERGVADGIFLVVGSLQPALGGAVVAHRITRDDLQDRLDTDPLVAEGIVEAEILEISPARADPRLAFLLETAEPR